MSIEAFEPNQGPTLETQGGILEALKASKSQSSSMPAEEVSGPIRCKACGMNEAYIPDGMKTCKSCHTVKYCSKDCMEWDWSSGGHINVCPGLTSAERKSAVQVIATLAPQPKISLSILGPDWANAGSEARWLHRFFQ